jgi:hypothetical protein
MRMAGSVSIALCSICFEAIAGEVKEQSYALAAASRLAARSEATIKALWVLDPPRMLGVAKTRSHGRWSKTPVHISTSLSHIMKHCSETSGGRAGRPRRSNLFGERHHAVDGLGVS